jgi:hypothetical protein
METQASESQAHEEAMLAKVDANEAKTQQEMMSDAELNDTLPDYQEQDDERLFAGKYKSVEDMEKAYKELESKLGQNKEQNQDEELPDVNSPEDAQQYAESKGVDYTELESEFETNGGLSEETYQSLADKGIPRELVNQYIEGQQAVAEQMATQLFGLAGGEQGYAEMVQWASENLSETEQAAFNNSLTDTATASFAIQGLYARYSASQGPSLVKGGSNPSGTSGYQSKAEMTRDMQNPMYRKDPAFRAQVARKIAKSNF